MTKLQARQILGLGVNFEASDLKKAYRRKAAETHPDKGGNAEDFQLVNAAYEFLLNGTADEEVMNEVGEEFFMELIKSIEL